MSTASYASQPRPSNQRPGLAGVAQAFGRAVWSQFHPRMLLALLLPFVVMLLAALVLVWLFWTPLTVGLTEFLTGFTVFGSVDAWITQLGVASLALWFIPLVAVFILMPAAGVVGLVVGALVVMPVILSHLGQGAYADVARRGSGGWLLGVWNAFWVSVIFVLGWIFTLPFWLFPVFALVLPVLWWAFAFNRMLRLDALADHATREERRQLWARHGSAYWALAGICAIINLLPPAWLFLPVFSGLLFAHFSLEALRQLRAEAVPEPRMPEPSLSPAALPAAQSEPPAGADGSFDGQNAASGDSR